MRQGWALLIVFAACGEPASAPAPLSSPGTDGGDAGVVDDDAGATDANASDDANDIVTDDGSTIEVDVDAGAPLPEAGAGPCATGQPTILRPVSPVTRSATGTFTTFPAGKGFASVVNDGANGDGDDTRINCADDDASSPVWLRFPLEDLASNGTITRVAVFARVRATSADLAKGAVGLFVVSSKNVAMSPLEPLDQSYGVVSRAFDKVPGSATPGWQAADLQDIEVRVSCGPTKPDKPVRITQVWAVVCIQ